MVLGTRRFEKWLPWIGAAVLAAGTAAVLVRFGDRADSTPAASENTPAAVPQQRAAASPVDPAAKKVAAEFIQTAVARRHLEKAWGITHPELKSGMTLAEWKTGALPVTPVTNLKDYELISYRVKESFGNEVLLEVLMVPKASAKGVDPQTFDIGLKAVGKGSDKHWLVNYWMTGYKPPVRPDPVAKG